MHLKIIIRVRKIYASTITRQFCRFSVKYLRMFKKNCSFKKYEPPGTFYFNNQSCKSRICRFSTKYQSVKNSYCDSQSQILPIFGKIIAYLYKRIVHFKNIIDEKNLYFENQWQIVSIFGKKIACMNFKKISHLKILPSRKVHISTVNPEFYQFSVE